MMRAWCASRPCWRPRHCCWCTCSRKSGRSGAIGEQPHPRTARHARLVARRPRAATGGVAPDRQRTRDRPLRSELAARVPHRAPVRHADRIDLRPPGGTGVNTRNWTRTAIAVLAIAALFAWKQKASDGDPAETTAAARPRAGGFDYGRLRFARCELPQPHSSATTAAYCAPFDVPENWDT